MIRVHRITSDTIDRMATAYARFEQRAKVEYRWAYDPVPFEQFKETVALGIMAGYWVEDTSVEDVVGFMLYCIEPHQSIEINVIYCELEDRKAVLDKLIVPFILDVRQQEGWDVVSYAMLGEQEHFIRSICWYGFKPVGQAIVNFDIMDSLSLQIMSQQKPPALPENITLSPWRPELAGGVAEAVFESFSKTSDAFWDPRFRTLLGARGVVALLTADEMGVFLPDCTTVALQDGVPVGFCFMVQSADFTGNIPLIGVRPSVKRQGLGLHLLQTSLRNAVQGVLDGKAHMLKVHATLDTDNISAIKMYRRMGFREEYNYPHVYLTREKALAFKQNKWC